MLATLPILAVLAASPLTLPAQLALAHQGDTIQLAPGPYPGVTQIIGKTGITIDARGPVGPNTADSLPSWPHPAVLDGVLVRGGSDITILGGEYRPKQAVGILVRDAAHIRLKGVSMFDSGLYQGVLFTDSTDVSVEGARMDRPRTGIVFQRVTGFTARYNTVVGFTTDGMDIAASHDGLVEFTGCMGNFLVNLQHPDCIQMWSTPGLKPTSNITVRYTMAFGNMQGISAFDHAGPGFDGLVFEHNTVEGLQPDGVSMQSARGSSARWNTVRTLPGARFNVHIGLNPGVTHCANVADAALGKPAWSDGGC